jgi:hypothetical protein
MADLLHRTMRRRGDPTHVGIATDCVHVVEVVEVVVATIFYAAMIAHELGHIQEVVFDGLAAITAIATKLTDFHGVYARVLLAPETLSDSFCSWLVPVILRGRVVHAVVARFYGLLLVENPVAGRRANGTSVVKERIVETSSACSDFCALTAYDGCPNAHDDIDLPEV